MKQLHNIPPIYDENSRVLILGSFPSVMSREQGFYYGHPQNRFWRVISAVFGCEAPVTTEEKKAVLLSNSVALWDVIASCEITGSSDSSIKNVVVNNVSEILDACKAEKIFVNGRTAEGLYKKYILPVTGRPCVCLPSTSPANAAWSLPELIKEWSCIKI
ncbi:MAG: DNA-deoxyinosine glycosylase [Clostridiales bacterium]|nr:DNA-deoxyinosine glycosylase [Clostridiales bacterium]